MIISYLWLFFYVVFMLFAFCVLPLYLLLRLILPRKWNKWLIRCFGNFWGSVTVGSTFSRVSVTGKELLPEADTICFVSNHQGLFDIPALIGYLPKPMGFIAKYELSRIPILSQWMKAIHCVFIDRKNARKTVASFNQAASIIKAGNPVVIFPEGTRSRSPQTGTFHAGSIKLALMAKAVIVPIAIDGSWLIYESRKRIRRATIRIAILPPIMPDDPITRDSRNLTLHLQRVIMNRLSQIRTNH
ncbi:MAG: 1-acyl-sn-glycerol-3-phosphate acyltransferase [Candidatus Cloacimonetes bacterium]|nr:1-acyl-sn-glycerol-3-phosphate acyltransferase [Candidatus Cloacimonadota bacterium]